MKGFFKFLYRLVHWTIVSILYIFRVPLVIAGIALLVGIFDIRIIACIIHIDFGIVVMAMPAVFTGKNITVFRKGERFSGTCTGYKFEHWNCGYDVHWNDSQNIKRYTRFDVPMIKFKYPFAVNVYSLNNNINLGIFL